MKELMKIFVFGSCVSRDAFEFDERNEFEVTKYYARSSFASISAKPKILTDVVNKIDSPWQARMVKADMSKEVLSDLSKTDCDAVLIDFIDERFSLLSDQDSLYTVSTEFKKAAGVEFLKSGKLIKPFSKDKLYLCSKGIDKISKELCGSDKKIIVNKVYWATKIYKAGHIVSIEDEKTLIAIKEANAFLNNLYNLISLKMPEVQFLEYSEGLLYCDENHKWGIDPFHYNESLYKEALRKLKNALSSRKNRKLNFNVYTDYAFGKKISFERVFVDEVSNIFLEEVTNDGSRKEVISYDNSRNLFVVINYKEGEVVSVDKVLKPVEIKKKIKNCYTLDNKNRLVQTSEPSEMFLLDENFQFLKKVEAGNKQWHGSASIGQKKNTIMYSEYTASKDEALELVHVWRSGNNGNLWSEALSLGSSPKFGVGDCRHFHTCFPDKKLAGRWFASTGDVKTDNKLYYTDDDGLTWQQIIIDNVIPSNLIEKSYLNNLLRFTDVYFEDEYLIWPTDDALGLGRSALVQMDTTRLPLAELKIISFFGDNLMRSAVKTDEGALFISESKHDTRVFDLFLSGNGKVEKLFGLENYSKQHSGGTLSRSSEKIIDGKAFALSDLWQFNDGSPGTVEIKIENEPFDELIEDIKPPKKEDASKEPLVFFHAQRTAGTTIKSHFLKRYGKNRCLYQRSKGFDSWGDVSESAIKKSVIYAAHYNYSNRFFESVQPNYFSIIRNPYERAISLYFYLKNRPEHKLHQLAINENIVDFYKKSIVLAPDYVSDTQTLRVCGEREFSVAKEVILAKYLFIAPFERLQEVFDVFEYYDFAEKTDRPAPIKKKFFDYYSDEEFLRLVEDQNKNDILLYEFSKRFFSKFYRDLDFN